MEKQKGFGQNRKYIIAITSGLGNQMCQYALFVYLKQLRQNVKVYCWNKHLDEHNGLELPKVFKNIKTPLVNSRAVSFYIDTMWFFKAVRYKLNSNLLNTLCGKYLPKTVVMPQWNTYLFVNKIIEELRYNIFVFSEINDAQNSDLKQTIETTNSVSIHIRRGDYVNNPKWKNTHGDICNVDYYQKAIKEINNRIEKPKFVVFSDDIPWATQNLPLANAIFVDWNNGTDSFRDMQMMSLCKHNIIANSSFSWWGAVLNRNKGKIVIAPKKWMNTVNQNKYAEKFLFPDWLTIDNQ